MPVNSKCSCRLIWPLIKPNNWVPSESGNIWKNIINRDYFRNSQRVFSWVPYQEREGTFCHSFLSKPHLSNMSDPSSLNIFLWKCETLQLNLPPRRKKSSSTIKKTAMGGRRSCLVERPTDRTRTRGQESVWVEEEESNACACLRISCVQTYTKGCSVCTCTHMCLFLRNGKYTKTQNVFYGKKQSE